MWPYAELSTDAKIGLVGVLSLFAPTISYLIKQLFSTREKNSERKDTIEDRLLKQKDDIIAEQKVEYAELKAEFIAHQKESQNKIEALQALLDHARGIK